MFERTVWAAQEKYKLYYNSMAMLLFYFNFSKSAYNKNDSKSMFFLHGKNIAKKTVKIKLCINCSLLTVCVGSGNMSWCLHKYKLEWSWCTAVSSRTGWILPKKKQSTEINVNFVNICSSRLYILFALHLFSLNLIYEPFRRYLKRPTK